MAHQLFTLPRPTAISNNLTLVSGAKVGFYLTGTSTPTDTYQDSGLTTPHTNPVVADSAGRLPAIYLDPSILYRVTFTDADDVEIYPAIDPVNDQILTQSIFDAYFSESISTGLLHPRTAAEIAVGVVPSDYEYEPGNVKRYGATGDYDGSTGTDDTAAIQRAIDVAQESSDFVTYGSHSPSAGTCRVFFPAGNYRITAALLVTKKIAIEGEGQAEFSSGARIVQTAADQDIFTVTPGAGGMSFSIERMTLKSAVAGSVTPGQLVNVQKGTSQCNSQRYIDCIFSEPQDKSLRLIGDDILISGCLFDVSGLSGEAIQLGTSTAGETASNVTITGCNFFSVVVRCILVYRAYGVLVSLNKVTQQLTPPNATDLFFDAEGGAPAQCERVTIVGNTFENVRGLFTASSIVSDVTIANNTGSGLGIGAGEIYNAINISGAASRISVIGNTLSGSYDTKNFFSASTATNVTVAANNFNNTGGSGAAVACGAMTGLAYPNTYSGFAVNVTADDFMALGIAIHGMVTLTYSASISTDASLGSDFFIVVSDGNAFTINNPTNPSTGQHITYTIKNNFGVLGTITWGSAFSMAAFTAPTAGGTSRSIEFRYDGTNWVELFKTPADVPN